MSDTPSPESMSSAKDSPPFDFEQFIADAEEKIAALKTRRASVETKKSKYQNFMNLRVDSETLKDIKTTQDITEDLEKAEYGLVSELIDIVGEDHLEWKKSGEGFWIFFRYAGIGFAIAVLLHKLIS